MSRTFVVIGPLALTLLFAAGCADPADPGSGAAGPSGDGAARADGRQAPGTGADGRLAGPWWSLPDCRHAEATFQQDRDSAAQGLPPGHDLQGEGVATVAVLVVECPSAVEGNQSVLREFSLVAVYHLLRPMDDARNAFDGFLREGFASDEGTAARLAQSGLPFVAAQIDLAGEGEPFALRVAADGASYDLLGPMPLQPQGPADLGDYVLRLRHGDGQPEAWLQYDIARTAEEGLARPVALMAQGGYLGDAFLGGARPGLVTEARAGGQLSLHEAPLATG